MKTIEWAIVGAASFVGYMIWKRSQVGTIQGTMPDGEGSPKAGPPFSIPPSDGSPLPPGAVIVNPPPAYPGHENVAGQAAYDAHRMHASSVGVGNHPAAPRNPYLDPETRNAIADDTGYDPITGQRRSRVPTHAPSAAQAVGNDSLPILPHGPAPGGGSGGDPASGSTGAGVGTGTGGTRMGDDWP